MSDSSKGEAAGQAGGAKAAGRLAGRIALITGASRGIGAAVARRFAAEGAKLVLTARTVGGLEEVDDAIRAAGGEPSLLVPLDIKQYDAIDQLGAALFERFGKLDILVGNAGVLGPLTPVPHIEVQQWQDVLDINLTANWRLIRSMDPLLRLSDAGRAIFVSSRAAQNPRPYWAAYAVSKAALEMVVQSYALEVQNVTPIRVNLIDPGATRTKMRAAAYPGENPDTRPHPDEITEAFVRLASADFTATGQVIKAQED
ncbi:SDR family NAD(P)-dependent oxidoreductase [Dongia soli]|uniref:SDR family NAD(P)-dependent oxidoreductase n=1 Tax=Dongia soli TaxID=600628 RepID=A0ABU5EEZ9_9PROT|nr:SDR family NAD(P)-dependent oxidoreductase [Dongia soli]MDY0884043.1 SDR family NAD(P)-dependent oxidoreductase [Dongia soli]